MKQLLCILFPLLGFSSFGQVVHGIVLDDAQNPIAFSEVRDTITQKTITADYLGKFTFVFSEKAALQISHPEYEIQVFEIEGEKSDTLYKSYILENRVQLVEGVVISSERMETVVDQYSVNVIDYLPFDNALLVLKSQKRERILSIEGQDTTYRSFPLGRIKPKHIFQDCFKNIHLLTEDSAYQIWIDSEFSVISSSGLKEFNEIVKPCVAEFDQLSVFENFTNRNKKYTLTSIDRESKKRSNFHISHDEVGEVVAKEVYDSIIRRYFIVTPDHANVISNKVWSGDLMELVSDDNQLHELITWYLKVRATELNIQSFPWNNRLYTLNQHTDSIHIFNDSCSLQRSKYHPFAKSNRVFDLIHDRASGSIYEVHLINGVYSLTQVPFESTERRKRITLDEAPQCKNIRIHDDWVYFMVKENDFFQINRIYIGRQFQD